jgi:predicted component of type VI protein secretion system
MPLRDGRIPVITSVLDRLAGDATTPSAPRPGTIGTVRPGTLTALRNSVLRDLEHLLNTRREEQLVPAEYHESTAPF